MSVTLKKLDKFLSRIVPRVIETIPSKANQTIKVVLWRNEISFNVHGFSQSGGLMPQIWSGYFNHFRHHYPFFTPKSILMFGLAGGIVVNQLNSTWPHSPITVIEIDPEMISLYKKYIASPSDVNLFIIQDDAFDWIKTNQIKYDLITVDIFFGATLPQNCASLAFLNNLKRSLTTRGKGIFNTFKHPSNQQVLTSLHSNIKQVFPSINSYYQNNNEILTLSLSK